MDKTSFFSNVNIIDQFLSKEYLAVSELQQLKNLLQKESYQEYFFVNLKSTSLFGQVNNIFPFDRVKEVELIDGGKRVRFHSWWPGQYLIKVADKIPEKVASVLQRIKTDNRLVLEDGMRAILNMPVLISKTLVPLIDRWLDAKYTGLVDHYAVELFQKFTSEKEHDAAVELFDVLARVVPGESKRGSFRYEPFYFNELKDKYLSKLFTEKGEVVLLISEKWLKKAIELDTDKKGRKVDLSTLWRPAIEPHEQNWGHDDVKEILTELVRDVLEEICKNKLEEGRKIIERFLKEDYSVFRRLALHTLRTVTGNEDLVRKILSDRDNFFNDVLKHEFLLLAKEKLHLLSSEDQRKFFERVLAGPPREKYKNSKDDIFQKGRLYEIRDILSTLRLILQDEPGLVERLQELEKELGITEHPDVEHPHFSWTGPTSPIDKEAIKKMIPDQFLEYIKKNFRPKEVHWTPSPEGLARIFQEVVSENPASYAEIAPKFYDEERIYAAYPTELLRGLEQACKNKEQFLLDPVLSLCGDLVGTTRAQNRTEDKNRREEFSFGSFSWARGAIGNFLEDLLRNEDFPISAEQMSRIKTILFQWIRSESYPTEEDEKQYGGDNMDFVTYCLNCNRGKAMRALMQYALRWARTFRSEQEREAEKGKGPFPPGPSRLESDVRAFLGERLRDEKSPSVQSTHGYFLPYLYYLDKEWVQEKHDEGLLFPKSPERKQFWEAHWEGFVSFSNFYGELFDFLRDDFRLAIDELVKESEQKKKARHQNRTRLAEHLMIAYWHELEKYESGSLIEAFFDKADSGTRGHAIDFLGGIYKEQKASCDPKKWKLLRDLWERRKGVEDSEIANFVRWLPYIPEPIGEVFPLVKPTIQHLHLGHQEEQLLNYVDQNVGSEPKLSMELMVELFRVRESSINVYFRKELIRQIIVKAKAVSQDPQVIHLINDAINYLGEMGYYEYREFLVEA